MHKSKARFVWLIAVVIILELSLFTNSTYAFQVSLLPADNLIQNPWFRSLNNPNSIGFDLWTNVDNKFTLSQKISNPTPNLLISGRCSSTKPTSATYCGTAAKISADDGNGEVGEDAFLYQIVEADPNNKKLKFFTHWVAHTVNPAEVNIYGSNDPGGEWTHIWTPFHQVALSMLKPPPGESQNWLWEHFTSLTPPVETIILHGYSFYKVEIRVNLYTPDGFKITGVYFAATPETGITPEPTLETPPTSSTEGSPTLTSTPTNSPTPTSTPEIEKTTEPTVDYSPTPSPEATAAYTTTPIQSPTPMESPIGPTLHISNLEGSWVKTISTKTLSGKVVITVYDNQQKPVTGVVVDGNWTSGLPEYASCTTGLFGECSIISGSLERSLTNVSFTVNNLSKFDFSYTPLENSDVDSDCNGTTYHLSR